MVAAGRPVTDSFGVVKVDELEGVRVSVNNEEIGRTGANGRLFVPSLASFIDNQISIDVKGMPLDYTFPESTLVVSPAYRAGAVVNFNARRLQAFVGTPAGSARTARSGPPSSSRSALDVEGRPVTFVTGRGGEFYVEDLQEGRYKAEMSAERNALPLRAGRDARRKGPFTDLGETICELPDEPTVPRQAARADAHLRVRPRARVAGGRPIGAALSAALPAPHHAVSRSAVELILWIVRSAPLNSSSGSSRRPTVALSAP